MNPDNLFFAFLIYLVVGALVLHLDNRANGLLLAFTAFIWLIWPIEFVVRKIIAPVILTNSQNRIAEDAKHITKLSGQDIQPILNQLLVPGNEELLVRYKAITDQTSEILLELLNRTPELRKQLNIYP